MSVGRKLEKGFAVSFLKLHAMRWVCATPIFSLVAQKASRREPVVRESESLGRRPGRDVTGNDLPEYLIPCAGGSNHKHSGRSNDC